MPKSPMFSTNPITGIEYYHGYYPGVTVDIDSHDTLSLERSENMSKDESKTSPAKKAANARYDAKTAKYYSLKLNTNTDRELIDFLEQHKPVQSYLKELIRNDMQSGK